ncbi:MAG: hypothetical protein GWN53_11095 [Gammaproteobacteria bacterium]|uniref:Uncharacterized protein n=1 Tax=Candidatus Kutchimonas denitrificans TaxID=3056748 RepID=A0AAE4ZBF5_9BACT|nr:hypothetical protein [Gemmatimonadota bacterium]NIR75131.1 hypothetical protein [Candidatus Kutchimonas denitrificans]NIU52941.1 hypothetical protein [Gemmatimonadota bacterium]NIV52410.1 hypothetical protein [Gammaproteobacteria bacterium]NIY44830.1 hypothetical protein [Gemmatimonadota bacterium]
MAVGRGAPTANYPTLTRYTGSGELVNGSFEEGRFLRAFPGAISVSQPFAVHVNEFVFVGHSLSNVIQKLDLDGRLLQEFVIGRTHLSEPELENLAGEGAYRLRQWVRRHTAPVDIHVVDELYLVVVYRDWSVDAMEWHWLYDVYTATGVPLAEQIFSELRLIDVSKESLIFVDETVVPYRVSVRRLAPSMFE